MKKRLLSLAIVFVILVSITCVVPASAARYMELPITMYSKTSYSETLFTLTSCEIYVRSNRNSQIYTNVMNVWVNGYFDRGTSIELAYHLFDASGNPLGTKYDTLSASDLSSGETCITLIVPDVTASVEIAAKNPYSWSNTYYYCKYRNVYSSDGRALAIHDLLLPVYESVGWHGDVYMYSSGGDMIMVPYCDIAKYQKVGWYLWEDYYYQLYRKNYSNYVAKGDYNSAYYTIENALTELEGTNYIAGIYKTKTALLDLWRKKANCPLAVTSSYANDNGDVTIYFRNVSYKTVKALKLKFDCYDVFGTKLSSYYDYYYCDDTWITTGQENWIEWEVTPYGTDRIGNIRITQVVYSDGTSWYR